MHRLRKKFLRVKRKVKPEGDDLRNEFADICSVGVHVYMCDMKRHMKKGRKDYKYERNLSLKRRETN